MNAKLFYAAPIFTNIPKIMVLTEDGVLYTEYQEYDVLQIEKQEAVSYFDFDIADFECEDYPVWLPISFEEAIDMQFAGQPNWLPRYLKEKQVDITPAPIALHA